MHGDDLDDLVRRAATPEPAAVERVAGAALAGSAGRVRLWPRAVAAIGTCLAAVVLCALWWSARQPTTIPGVYRVEIVSDARPGELAEPGSAPIDGVFRAEATQTAAPSRVIRVIAEDGTTWVLSTIPDDDRLPEGTAIVIGAGGEHEP
jgi:hypothetical protein